MSGRALVITLVAFTVIFGAVLWYFQTYAFYAELGAETVTIAGRDYAVSDYRGIDAMTSPLKLRSCFYLPAVPDAPVAENPTPLVAPGWFDCFDARTIAEALEAGDAIAYLAQPDEFDGVDRLVARYADGRAFEWRQFNDKYN